ncbi:MAG: 2TM domain-containing protein [Saprospiraceae bacterium]
MIKTFLSSGLIYATIMVGFNYLDGNGFSWWRFILLGSGFGLFMSLISMYTYKKQNKKIESDKDTV